MTPTLQISTYIKSDQNMRRLELVTYLLGDLRVLRLVEALWSLVPIRADTLTCELYLVLVFLDDLTEAKVGDFDLSVVEYDVLRLQIVVNDLLLLVVQVLQA